MNGDRQPNHAAVRVRDGVPSDAQALAEVQLRAWRTNFVDLLDARRLQRISPNETEQKCRRWLIEQTPKKRVWVAQLGGQVVGHVRICEWDDTDDLPAGTAKVNALYVDPALQGQGIGTRLLECAVRAAQDAGAPLAALWTPRELAATRRFYQRRGWSPDPSTTKPWRGLIEIRYVRRLSQPMAR